jgi:phosphatidylglycerol:prolipoprotein diacylglycerol transferase
MIDFVPPSILVQIGPFPIHFYGLAYALGLAATYLVMSHEARRRGHDAELLINGLIVVAIAAIIGGRLYHVIDQIAYYKDHIVQAILPVDQAGNFIGFGGLGVYGGIITGTLAAIVYVRRKRADFWLWADIVAPGLFAMQAVARWGNFFNQELYGPPTNLPWGIAIQCSHRIAQYACPAGSDPAATLGEHFHPLFLYESLSGLFGVLALMFVARRLSGRVRTGDLLALFFIWYGITRFTLETLRADNWTFFGIPTAQIFSTLSVLVGLGLLVVRHRIGAPTLVEADARARQAEAAAAAAHEATSTEDVGAAAEADAPVTTSSTIPESTPPLDG